MRSILIGAIGGAACGAVCSNALGYDWAGALELIGSMAFVGAWLSGTGSGLLDMAVESEKDENKQERKHEK